MIHKKPTRASWKHMSPIKPARKGTGVQYGKLNLSPKDHYHVHTAKNTDSKLRIIVMGGNEEVGRNMTLLEYGDDIIIIDMGIQFAEDNMRGIDGIVPDLSYLKGREHQVRAVIITHMHMDHIGAIPYLMPLLPNVPIFSAPITLSFIAKKLEYHPGVKVDLQPVDEASKITLGNFTVTFLGVSHSVPSALAAVVETPCGKIVHTGDFKVDLNPTDEDTRRYLANMRKLREENVLALLSDSTNASQAGNQLMEHSVIRDLEEIVKSAKSRLLFGMISTNVERLKQIIALAEKYERHVAIGGLSLKTTLEVAENLGYITPRAGTIINIEDIKGLSPEKVLAIFPGAQGETNAAFYKLAEGELRDMRILPGDTVVFSSSVIPGNERSVQFITDKFYRLGAKVINYRNLNIHAGGHAKSDDLGEVVNMIRPKYLIPIEGQHAFLHHHAEAAIAAGFPRERIFIADNGQIIEFTKDQHGTLTREKIVLKPIFVDGNSIGQVDHDILRERTRLGNEGLVLIRLGKTVTFTHIGFRKKRHVLNLEKKITHMLKENPRTDHRKIEQLIERKTGSSPNVIITRSHE